MQSADVREMPNARVGQRTPEEVRFMFRALGFLVMLLVRNPQPTIIRPLSWNGLGLDQRYPVSIFRHRQMYT